MLTSVMPVSAVHNIKVVNIGFNTPHRAKLQSMTGTSEELKSYNILDCMVSGLLIETFKFKCIHFLRT